MTEKIKNPDFSKFYTSNSDRFLIAFDKIRLAVVEYISKQSTAETANDIANEAVVNFEKILPEYYIVLEKI